MNRNVFGGQSAKGQKANEIIVDLVFTQYSMVLLFERFSMSDD